MVVEDCNVSRVGKGPVSPHKFHIGGFVEARNSFGAFRSPSPENKL